MARQTQCPEGNYKLLSACCAGALAEFSESAHIKRDLIGKFNRVLAYRFLELDIITANGMFTRGVAFLCLCRHREPCSLAVPVALDCHALARHAR